MRTWKMTNWKLKANAPMDARREMCAKLEAVEEAILAALEVRDVLLADSVDKLLAMRQDIHLLRTTHVTP